MTSSTESGSHVRNAPPNHYRKQLPPILPKDTLSPKGASLPSPTSLSGRSSGCCGCCGTSSKNYHLRVVGPSMAGKTTLVHYLLHGQAATNILPTNGKALMTTNMAGILNDVSICKLIMMA